MVLYPTSMKPITREQLRVIQVINEKINKNPLCLNHYLTPHEFEIALSSISEPLRSRHKDAIRYGDYNIMSGQ
jgi:hypothetical protein